MDKNGMQDVMLYRMLTRHLPENGSENRGWPTGWQKKWAYHKYKNRTHHMWSVR